MTSHIEANSRPSLLLGSPQGTPNRLRGPPLAAVGQIVVTAVLFVSTGCAQDVYVKAPPAAEVRVAGALAVVTPDGHRAEIPPGFAPVSVIVSEGQQTRTRVVERASPRPITTAAAAALAAVGVSACIGLACGAANPALVGDVSRAIAMRAFAAGDGPIVHGGQLEDVSWWTAPAIALGALVGLSPLACALPLWVPEHIDPDTAEVP